MIVKRRYCQVKGIYLDPDDASNDDYKKFQDCCEIKYCCESNEYHECHLPKCFFIFIFIYFYFVFIKTS
jgi:hypothetical protein